MSRESFLRFLQELITMTDEKDAAAIVLARGILSDLYGLARVSGKAGQSTLALMQMAVTSFEHLMRSREDFAGRPGDPAYNQACRFRLQSALMPHC